VTLVAAVVETIPKNRLENRPENQEQRKNQPVTLITPKRRVLVSWYRKMIGKVIMEGAIGETKKMIRVTEVMIRKVKKIVILISTKKDTTEGDATEGTREVKKRAMKTMNRIRKTTKGVKTKEVITMKKVTTKKNPTNKMINPKILWLFT
jgi:hypothetical protein